MENIDTGQTKARCVYLQHYDVTCIKTADTHVSRHKEAEVKGLELAKRLYEERARKLFENELPDLIPQMAVGLVGEGSECFASMMNFA